ncbi:MAG: COX15/CtaA family protein [Flavobacteriales bacterium]|nr:COX15/CtaA family protein [Flavobacteriales bacterium]
MHPSVKLARLLAIFTLINIFLVILAGSIVRMTGAGMGCPDWPKCFGYLVPPMDIEPLTFSAGRDFENGEMVILNDTLWVAEQMFTSTENFDRAQWHKYPKHDYAAFNVAHTWTEYINRLVGALAGIFAFALVVVATSLFVKRINLKILWPAVGALFMIGVAAWLGKVVVDGNLDEGSITLHMLCSLFIILFLMLCIHKSGEMKKVLVTKIFRLVTFFMLMIIVIQIVLGTLVREKVDLLMEKIGRHGIIAEIASDRFFLIHRSFAWLVAATTIGLFFLNNRDLFRLKAVNVLMILVLCEIAVGTILTYFSFPEMMQPMHLLLALGMFSFSLNVIIRTQRGT